MKKLLLLLLPVMYLSCCDDDDAVPQPPPPPACLEVLCETEEEFYGKAIMNGECWVADWVDLHLSPGGEYSIHLNKNEVDGVSEGLSILLFYNTILDDTIWIGSNSFTNPSPSTASSFYGYRGVDASLGTFGFEHGLEPTYTDYLLIDYFNADTSIIEGRFQISFSNRSMSSFANAPDSMRLGCGSFRVKRD
ncbi:hypothetical protein [Lewinella sp. LCG006]|uniref:hypothetical protein n=1 Tax=Lewinella sp. LCG006 TaxID=3231911 RepID=UPI00345FFE26